VVLSLVIHWLAIATFAVDAFAEPPQPQLIGVPPPPSESDRERHARRMLEDARAFRRQGRLESAEAAVMRGLAARPRDPRLLRERARILEQQGRTREAEAARRRADSVAPHPAAPPRSAHDTNSRGVLVVLVPPPADRDAAGRIPNTWPDPVVAETLERRLRMRLPEATVVHADPGSVEEARTWIGSYAPRAALSIRVDRAYCEESIKDGPFAVGELRVAAASPGEIPDPPETARSVRHDPPGGEACRADVVARAFEEALDLPAVGATLAEPASVSPWSATALRALFPGIGVRLREALDAGKRRLASGHLALAGESFAQAERIDAEDPEVRAYLDEVEQTLAIVDELARPGEEIGVLDPRFTPAQRAAAEARIAEEKRRRESLLAALAVLDEDVNAPTPRTIAALRPTPIDDSNAVGPTLARERAGGPVSARIAYAPDGSALSRYFLREGSERPVLREEDTSGDGRPDRWVIYQGDVRREILEDSRNRGVMDLRFSFSEDGGTLERVELDPSGDGLPERVFHYADGRLRVEASDTTGDGSLDRFERFDGEGRVELREEDLNGDGKIDVRSIYQKGRLARQEIIDAEATGDLSPRGPWPEDSRAIPE
jgi:tetratricopeptide (TPR) repeat protein